MASTNTTAATSPLTPDLHVDQNESAQQQDASPKATTTADAQPALLLTTGNASEQGTSATLTAAVPQGSTFTSSNNASLFGPQSFKSSNEMWERANNMYVKWRSEAFLGIFPMNVTDQKYTLAYAIASFAMVLFDYLVVRKMIGKEPITVNSFVWLVLVRGFVAFLFPRQFVVFFGFYLFVKLVTQSTKVNVLYQ